jgi:hypothetical protein
MPPPTVDWFKNGVLINETIASENDLFISTGVGGAARLRIESAGVDDNADYTCVASNDAGMDRSVLTVDQIMGKSVQLSACL